MLLLPQWLDKPLLFAGAQRYTFYSGSASSQARITVATPEEAPFVRLTLQGYTGESAYYPSEEDAFAQAEAYGAALLLVQRSADVTDYYYYSAQLEGGVALSCGSSTCTSRCVRAAALWAARSSSADIENFFCG